jgi:hypothetical protein
MTATAIRANDQRTTLRVQIKSGVDALEKGEFAEVDDVDLESYLQSLAAESSTDVR